MDKTMHQFVTIGSYETLFPTGAGFQPSTVCVGLFPNHIAMLKRKIQ